MHPSINQIASNSSSGAAEILRLAGEVFAQLRIHQTDLCHGSLEQAQTAIFETSVALVQAQPDMSPLLRLASIAISAATTATSAQDALKSAEDQALKFIENAERAVLRAALHAANLILPGTAVMTHSRSSTVLTALVQAKLNGRDFSVVATESRPGLEGRTLAQDLARKDIRVSLIADSAASLAMYDVDVVIVGSDTITHEVVVNKIGTRMLGLAARERGLPFYAVCDTSKFINGEYWRRPDLGKGSLNYFEATPLSDFTGIITEDGILSSDEAAHRAERVFIDKPLSDALEQLRQQIR